MQPRPVTDWDLQCFAPGVKVVYHRPPDMEDCGDLELIRMPDCLKIPFIADDRDTPKPEGTIWFTVWGHQLPPIDAYVWGSTGETPAGYET
jgi:hypothetical protein